jgi:osmotically-inducible protein OsmY
MKSGRKKLNGIICAYAVTLACGFGGHLSRVDAQTTESTAVGRSTVDAGPTSQDTNAANRQLQVRVAAALRAEHYLDDRHINVAVQSGVVVLSGLVYSAWDLQTALRTARKVAGRSRVIDSLAIEEGGR